MSTITTTVTSAHADGRTVTETTTESAPGPSTATTPGEAIAKSTVEAWMAGKFATIEGIAEHVTADGVLSCVDGEHWTNIPWFNKEYKGHAGSLEWCNLVGANLDFGADMQWSMSPGKTANVGHGTLMQQFGSIATGKKTGVTLLTCEFHAGPGGKLAGIKHYWPISLNNCFPSSGLAGSNVAVAVKLITGWAAGDLHDAEKVKEYITNDCLISFANELDGVFHDYVGYKGMNDWCVSCDTIDWGPAGPNWEWAEGGTFCVGRLVDQVFTCKATGKSVSGKHAEVTLTTRDGKIASAHHYFPAEFNACY